MEEVWQNLDFEGLEKYQVSNLRKNKKRKHGKVIETTKKFVWLYGCYVMDIQWQRKSKTQTSTSSQVNSSHFQTSRKRTRAFC